MEPKQQEKINTFPSETAQSKNRKKLYLILALIVVVLVVTSSYLLLKRNNSSQNSYNSASQPAQNEGSMIPTSYPTQGTQVQNGSGEQQDQQIDQNLNQLNGDQKDIDSSLNDQSTNLQ